MRRCSQNGQVIPLTLEGNVHEAVKFYENALDAIVLGLQTFGEIPENPEYPTPVEAKDRVINAHLKVGNTDLMLSDTFPGHPYQIGSQVTAAIIINDLKNQEKYSRNYKKAVKLLCRFNTSC